MTIVAPVDKSDRAADVLDNAVPLAAAFDETIHVVHVLTRSRFIELERTNVNESGTTIPMEDIREVAREIAAKQASNLDAASKPVGLIGDPAEAVVEYATQQEARYIVTAGRKRSATGKAIFGSVGQSIIMNASCPVVISTTE
jgi:nucleotide-binding universal stress UspA family protein